MGIPAQIDRYAVERKLSEGGMAEVLLARTRSPGGFEKRVVLKSVLPQYSEEPAFKAMLLNEARLAARLDHANVVQVLDLVEEAGRYFIVMEYLEGHNLRQLQRQAHLKQRRLPPGVACRILTEVLAGLSYAHAHADAEGHPLGLVHRDVSPPNVIVTWSGGVKLIDFGIAKATEQVSQELTRAGQFKGKCSYMSPEQVQCLPVDRRSDIFSAGIVLWELLTGERLFLRSSEVDSMVAVCRAPVEPPSALIAGLPPELDAICSRALSRNADDRYGCADQMRQELEAVIVGQSWPAGSLAVQRELESLFDIDDFEQQPTIMDPSPPTVVFESSDTEQDVRAPAHPPRWRRTVLAALTGFAIGLGGLALLGLLY